MNLTIVLSLDPALLSLAERAVCLLTSISEKEDLIMSTVQEAIDEIAAEKTLIDSLTVFVKGLEEQIKTLGLPVATQAEIDKMFSLVAANKAAIAAAMETTPPPPAAP